MKRDFKRINISKKEIDEPFNNKKSSIPVENELLLKENKVDKNLFNTIKGHNLLGWCVGIVVVVYIVERSLGGKVSEVGKSVIEIFKLLIFSLSGYLYGTNSAKGK
ncbi:MAG: hypothetical protein SOR31_07045 [Parvimonas sp.]|uniref:hypothetical protein n=1 Tax=Parvimonas sp. TaxID=1944660 RepID=UPI002A74E7BD|nr:hypothetical protein [Parvimonas sp.]MDY3051363.1 hypothetical protein [Parvimonas sp.]